MILINLKNKLYLLSILFFSFFLFGNEIQNKVEYVTINDFKLVNIIEEKKTSNIINFNWIKEYNFITDYLNIKKMIKTQDNEYALIGELSKPEKKKTESSYEQYSNIIVFKSNKAGEKEWATEIDLNNRIRGYDIINTNSNDYLVVGGEYYPAYEDDGVGIINGKLDKNGNILWIKNYHDNDLAAKASRARNIIETENSNYYIISFIVNNNTLILNKYNNNGEKIRTSESKFPYFLFIINKNIKINNSEYILLDNAGCCLTENFNK